MKRGNARSPFSIRAKREKKRDARREKAWLRIQKIGLGWLGGAEEILERPSGGLGLALGHEQRWTLGKRSERKNKRKKQRKGKT